MHYGAELKGKQPHTGLSRGPGGVAEGHAGFRAGVRGTNVAGNQRGLAAKGRDDDDASTEIRHGRDDPGTGH
jgi:hypothetical protein